mgnify:CR=1 FL=1
MTDNNSITAVQQKIENVPNNIKVDVFAIDNGTTDEIGNRLNGLAENVTVPVKVTDNIHYQKQLQKQWRFGLERSIY